MTPRRTSLALILSSLLVALPAAADLVIISDIDDTIRQADVVDKVSSAVRALGDPKPFPDLRALYLLAEARQRKAGERFEISYISASYPFIYEAWDWVERFSFPAGLIFQRRLGQDFEETTFKKRRIHQALDVSHVEGDEVWFFGDNAGEDERIYSEVAKERGLKDARIFIRDVRLQMAPYSALRQRVQPLEGVRYFLTAADLLDHPAIRPLAAELRPTLLARLRNESLVPRFLIRRLAAQLSDDSCLRWLAPLKEWSQHLSDARERIESLILQRM